MKAKHILLIDDDEVTNYINTKVLKAALPDAEIMITLNGIEAIKLIDDRMVEGAPLFDTIMVDISMPYMDGWEFVEALSAPQYSAYHSSNIVMLTSSVFEDDMERARSYHVIKSFFSKPLDAQKVADIFNDERIKQDRI